MKYSDVFKKSDLGRKEVKYHTLGILPREARTLLIMIDGKRTYQNYLDTLDNGKMFVEFGGVAPLFELLLELGCIEIIGQESSEYESQHTSQTTKESMELRSQTVKETSEAEFDKTFNSVQSDISAIGNTTVSKTAQASYESTKSDLAAYIESNALPEEAWGYLLSLEQCNDPAQLLSLVQQIQQTSNSALVDGMADFSKKITIYL
ncbi:hypothetical protein M0N77_12510 [Psychrobacter sp. AH5]|uniref:hypothetical protein n=1 Tax=Psychrobacter sp. AH5 TaxID=2937433 RepID=UPI003341ABC9